MLTTLRREYAHLLTSGAQLLLLLAGFFFHSHTAWLWLLGSVCAISLLAWQSTLRRLRTVRGTPTSRIASAAQGYVELVGRGKPDATPTLSRYSMLPCLWCRYKLEKRSGSKNEWHTEDSGETSAPFQIDDGSGQCVVDPQNAEILTRHKDTWSKGDYRYTEWRLLNLDQLYVIGEFRTVGGSNSDITRDDLVKQVLAEWKENNADLLRRFDLDNNGVLDMREWMLARQAAKREADKRLLAEQNAPDIHFMARPQDGRLFLISNLDQENLAQRYLLWTWAHCIIFCSALGAWAWLLRHPGYGRH